MLGLGLIPVHQKIRRRSLESSSRPSPLRWPQDRSPAVGSGPARPPPVLFAAGALASLARFLSDSGGAGASTTLSVASVRAAMACARRVRRKSGGVKISLGTAARGAAVKGGSAAAARRVVWRRCGRAGLRCFLRLRARSGGLLLTDSQDDVEGRGAKWRKPGQRLRRRPLMAREGSFFDWC